MNDLNLVLLPGLLCDASVFHQQADALADMGSVAVADLTREDSIAALAVDVLAQVPEGPLVLIGMSMGGYVAFEIMRRAPERVQALVLICTSAHPDTRDASAGREKLIVEARGAFPAVVDSLLTRMAHPDHANTPEVGGVFQSMANSLGSAVFTRQQRAIIGRSNSRSTLAHITCPTLVLGGRQDALIPLEVQRELAAAIAGAQLEIIEDCGHLVPLEQPEVLTRILRDWLGKLPRSRPRTAAR